MAYALVLTFVFASLDLLKIEASKEVKDVFHANNNNVEQTMAEDYIHIYLL